MDRPTDASTFTGPPDGDGLGILVVGLPWPLETFVDRLLRGLVGRGHRLVVLSGGRPDSDWLGRLGATWKPGPGPLPLSRLGRHLRSATRDVGALTATPSVVAAMSDRRPRVDTTGIDVVYAPWINTLTEHPDLLDLDVPVVTSCRGALVTIAPWNPRRAEHTAMLATVFDRAVAVHCVSDAIVDDAALVGLDRSKATVIRPAVDPGVFAVPDRSGRSGSLRLLGVGALSWRKAYEQALLAVARANDAGVDVRLRIVGDGADRQHLRFVIDDLDIADRVELLGKLPPDGVRRELEWADAFVHTSSSEGISNAVLEAMATGLPAVTVDSGGMAEAVRDGVDGYLVGVRDVAATADAFARLAADPSLRDRMGAAARQRIETSFDLADQVAGFDALLRRAAGR